MLMIFGNDQGVRLLEHVRQLERIWYLFSEVVEHCCSIPSLNLGETLANVAKDMDIYTVRLPLGVTAGITPFNFPAMIPLWVRKKGYSRTVAG